MRAALPVSAAGHAAIIGLLLLLPTMMPAPPKIDLAQRGRGRVFAPAPPPPVVAQPAAPAHRHATGDPPQPIVEQPPPPAPAPKPRPKPVQPVDRPPPEMTLPLPVAPAPATSPQVASLPPPVQAPVISADYRSILSLWLESHKRYPEDARQRGEEGRAVLRFRVDRNGRVLDFAVVSSTGYRRPRRRGRGDDAWRDPAAVPGEHDLARDRGIGDNPLRADALGQTQRLTRR